MKYLSKQLTEVYLAQEDYLRQEQLVVLEISRICQVCATMPREELRNLLLEMKCRITTGKFSDPFAKMILSWIISQLQAAKS